MRRWRVWWSGRLVFALDFGVFARGNTTGLGAQYGLGQTECAELARVALCAHDAPVTRILAFALRRLKTAAPGLRLIVSFADPNAGHHGGIYAGGNWLFTGCGGSAVEWVNRQTGECLANREYSSRVRESPTFGKRRRSREERANWERHAILPKFRYLMPLDRDMARQIEPLRKPYPKRTPESGTSVPTEAGGAMPTRALQADEAPTGALTGRKAELADRLVVN